MTERRGRPITNTAMRPYKRLMRKQRARLRRHRKKGRKVAELKDVLKINSKDVLLMAMKEGVTPLEVMLANMRYYWQRAGKATEQLEACEHTEENIAEVQALSDEVKTLRNVAQACAVEAAPYCHSKLASLTLKPRESEDPVEENLRKQVQQEVETMLIPFRSDG